MATPNVCEQAKNPAKLANEIAREIVLEVIKQSKGDLNGDGRVNGSDTTLGQSLQRASFEIAQNVLPTVCAKLGRPILRSVAVALSIPGPDFLKSFSPKVINTAGGLFMKIMEDPDVAKGYFSVGAVKATIPKAERK